MADTADTNEHASLPLPQGDLRLLETVGAQRLLGLAVPARVGYRASDGTRRVVPTWFHWTGEELVMATFLAAPHIRHPAARLRALGQHPRVAVVIDTDELPPSVLTLRGDVALTEHAGVVAEYALAAHRYMGPEAAADYLSGLDDPVTKMVRIGLRPTWVGLLDFETRLPGGMRGAQS